ncbi:hypothetical protein L9F63_018076, partial [Diploptera punctata]
LIYYYKCISLENHCDFVLNTSGNNALFQATAFFFFMKALQISKYLHTNRSHKKPPILFSNHFYEIVRKCTTVATTHLHDTKDYKCGKNL